MGGKTAKIEVLPAFCEIEPSGGSNGRPVMWPPQWRSCLPKICHILALLKTPQLFYITYCTGDRAKIIWHAYVDESIVQVMKWHDLNLFLDCLGCRKKCHRRSPNDDLHKLRTPGKIFFNKSQMFWPMLTDCGKVGVFWVYIWYYASSWVFNFALRLRFLKIWKRSPTQIWRYLVNVRSVWVIS